MKLATYSRDGRDALGLIVSGGLVNLSERLSGAPKDMIDLITRWGEMREAVTALKNAKPDLPLESVTLRAPVQKPSKILAIGLNYKDHIQESKMPTPEYQIWFSKMPSAVNGPFDAIELPAVSDCLDYEAELVAIVGRRSRNVPRERAKEVVFGYCVGNDVSVRDWQLRVSQWILGKSFDTHAPFGPWITVDETDATDLDIRCLVNGEVRQASNTRHLLFDVYSQIAHLSEVMTLEPGDVLFTGTPGGIGHARNPPLHLKPGDLVRVEVDKLGAIENRVMKGSKEVRL